MIKADAKVGACEALKTPCFGMHSAADSCVWRSDTFTEVFASTCCPQFPFQARGPHMYAAVAKVGKRSSALAGSSLASPQMPWPRMVTVTVPSGLVTGSSYPRELDPTQGTSDESASNQHKHCQ